MAPRRSRMLVAALTCATVTPAARGQEVDYAGLQQVFGEPVTTSVTGKPQRASDAPASLVIIGRDDIARSPARTVPDLIATFTGVAVNRWTAGQSDVAVRGGVQTYNARLLVLVDGRQVYLDHYGMTDWNLLGVPLEAIQQIELVRGPATALFGFNAASGVVNIITRDPRGEARLSAAAEGGTRGYGRLAAAATVPLGGAAGLELSGSHAREDERAIPAALYRPGAVDPVVADQASARLAANPDPQTRVELSGGWAGNRQLEFLPSQILTEQRFRSANAGVVLDHDTGWGSATARAYTNWLDATYGVGAQPTDVFYAVSALKLRNRISVGQASVLIRLNQDNALRLAGEYRRNDLFSDESFSRRIGYRVLAASAMLDLHPAEGVTVSLAARIDGLRLGQGGATPQPAVNAAADYDRSVVEPSFNAAVQARLGESGSLRLNGGRGVQVPSLVDLGARIAVPEPMSPLPTFIAGDPVLRPVVVWSAEAGLARRLGDLARLDASVFFTRTERAIASPGDAPAFALMLEPQPVVVSRFANVGAFESLGIEVAADGRLSKALGWRASYTWTRLRQDLPDGDGPFAYAFSPRATTPAHVAALALNYSAAGWSAAVTARYTAATRQFAFLRTAALALVPVSGAAALDAKVGRQLTRHLAVFAAGENLTAARGAYGSPLPADRRLRAGLDLGL